MPIAAQDAASSAAVLDRHLQAFAKRDVDAIMTDYSEDSVLITPKAELAEQGVMALSGHKTPRAARLYVKRTEHQRVCAAAKRRDFVDQNETATRVEMKKAVQSRNRTKRSGKIL